MRNFVRNALVGAIVLLPAAGGIALVRSGQPASINVAQNGTHSGTSPFAEIETRRTALEQRIADGRHANALNGVAYFTALDQQHKILVKQKRAEAQGLTEAVRRELLADIDRANAGIDKHLRK